MSHLPQTHRMRQLAIGALVGAAAFGVVASPASAAQSKTLTFKCKYPLIGTNPLSVKITLNVPDTWPGGVPTDPFLVNAVATASGNTVPGLALVEGLAGVEGVAVASSTLTSPSGLKTPVNVTTNIPKSNLAPPVPDPLVLPATGVTPSLTLDESGTYKVTLDKLALNLKATDAAGEAIILPPVTKDLGGGYVKDSDMLVETFDVYCQLDAGQDTTLATITVDGPVCDCGEPPTTPGEGVLTPADFTPTSINLKWTASTDVGSGVKEYVIRYEDHEIRVPASFLSYTLTGLGPDSEYFVSISAVDNAGNESDPLELFYITPPLPPVPPLPLITLTPRADNPTSVYLCWTHPSPTYVAYDIYRDNALVGTQSAADISHCFRVYGLSPETTYEFKVVPKLESGVSGPAATTTATTLKQEPPKTYAFDVAGSAQLKTLVKGNVPLKGGAVLRLGATPTVLGDSLTLAPTQARLIGLGFLPVTAKLAFVSSGSLSGSLLAFNGTVLSQQVRIKVLEAKLFGAIPLAGGNSCQTKSLTTLALSSPSFTLARGGAFTGQFSISDLNGCGALNGLVSPAASGAGNTISVNLTPKA